MGGPVAGLALLLGLGWNLGAAAWRRFRARLLDLGFGPGTESLEVRLFSEAEVPWDEIAFAVVKETLKLYFSDRKAGSFPLRTGDIITGVNGMPIASVDDAVQAMSSLSPDGLG
jgi:hypothetical protein